MDTTGSNLPRTSRFTSLRLRLSIYRYNSHLCNEGTTCHLFYPNNPDLILADGKFGLEARFRSDS
jgi:hypothetical protein